jgi:AcrR family transcriptional regulator
VSRGRPRDEQVTTAILDATRELLARDGFAAMSMDAVAATAGVGKPAIYRRYRTKAELVTAAIDSALPPMEAPAGEDTEAGLRLLFVGRLPPDMDAYLTLIGGLAAERARHPELLAAFRERILVPRRALVEAAIAAGQARGDIRDDLPAVRLLDMLAGQILARAFAGADTGAAWRRQAFDHWWELVRSR